MLTDSLSLVKLLDKMKFDKDSFYSQVILKIYSNISVKDAMEWMGRLFFKYQNVIPNAHLILELMEVVLSCVIIKFQKKKN